MAVSFVWYHLLLPCSATHDEMHADPLTCDCSWIMPKSHKHVARALAICMHQDVTELRRTACTSRISNAYTCTCKAANVRCHDIKASRHDHESCKCETQGMLVRQLSWFSCILREAFLYEINRRYMRQRLHCFVQGQVPRQACHFRACLLRVRCLTLTRLSSEVLLLFQHIHPSASSISNLGLMHH